MDRRGFIKGMLAAAAVAVSPPIVKMLGDVAGGVSLPSLPELLETHKGPITIMSPETYRIANRRGKLDAAMERAARRGHECRILFVCDMRSPDGESIDLAFIGAERDNGLVFG